jgi:glyoxylase-like metal-dependent hydrolase (beta-lactamase superfamily II)
LTALRATLSSVDGVGDPNVFNPILLEAHNPGPMTGGGNNTYLLIDSGRSALIDAGVGEPRHLAALDRQLTEHRAQLDDVLVTHAHADHASGAPAIDAAHRGVRFRKFPWPDEDSRYAVEWRPIRDGDRLRFGRENLIALHTPGHSPDHVSFWHEASRTVFTGDLVVQGSSVMIEASKGGDLLQYLGSLERILALDTRRLLPAHGPEVTEPAALLNQYLEHRRAREAQVLEALADGRETVQAIADYIYDGLAPPLRPAAEENVRAHLRKLKAEGRASETAGRWST